MTDDIATRSPRTDTAVIDALSLEQEPYLEIHCLLRERIGALEARLMARFTDEELNALWQSFDGFETSDDDISGDMVKVELLRRGLST